MWPAAHPRSGSPTSGLSTNALGRRTIPRLRLDLDGADVAAGCSLAVLTPLTRRRAEALRESLPESAVPALSVRSAFDAYLATAPWPAGSEILVTALTIPDMPRIVREHGYVPVPVDLEPETLVPRLDTLAAAIGPRTVAWLHAHLFGSWSDLTPHADLLARHGVGILEDCAQAYCGEPIDVAPFATASFFSFGTIKTATASGGAIACVHDDAHRQRLQSHLAQWPREATARRLRRIIRCGGLLVLGHPRVYRLLTSTLRRLGRDPDRWVHATTRSFRGDDFFTAIRTRPSALLTAMVARRLAQDVAGRVRTRSEIAQRILRSLPAGFAVPGAAAPVRTHWVVPITSDDPQATVAALTAAGFDATSCSSLAVVAHPEGRTCPNTVDLLERIVYVPMPRSSEEQAIRALEHVLSQMEPVATGRPPVREPVAA